MRSGPDKLWTIDDVAEYLQVKPSVIKYWMYNSDIPVIRLGKQVRFDPEDIRTWIERRKSIVSNSTAIKGLRKVT